MSEETKKAIAVQVADYLLGGCTMNNVLLFTPDGTSEEDAEDICDMVIYAGVVLDE